MNATVRTLLAVVAVAALAALASSCSQQPLDVAPEVDLARFQGRWYEIARLPRPSQDGCADTTASYRLVSGSEMYVENECRLANGALRNVVARAKVTNAAVPAKLSVDFGGFYGDYWILEVGSNYEYAVVGHPTRQYLWILNRAPKLDEVSLAPILRRAADRGFNVERLEFTAQTEP